jgi:hypothetical protein
MLSRRNTNLVLMLIAAILAMRVGPAFTAAITPDPSAGRRLGYGTQSVSGADVTTIGYTLRADGVTVDTVTFVVRGDLTQDHGSVGFTVAGTPGPSLDCGAGTNDGTTATTFACAVVSLHQDVATIQATDISVVS